MEKLSPEALAAAVPPEMRELRRWVGHREKRPLTPWSAMGAGAFSKDSGAEFAAAVNRPGTWGTFEEALGYYRRTFKDPDCGIGFVFCEEDGLLFLDFDAKADGATLDSAMGELGPLAAATYAEVSPSGRGAHVFALSPGPALGRHREDRPWGHVERYTDGRFSTVTGAKLPGSPSILVGLAGAPTTEAPPTQPPAAAEPERLPEVERALEAIDPDLNYEEWIKVGMALKAGLGDTPEAKELWRKWSAGGFKFVEGEPEEKWDSFQREGVGLGSLFELAAAAGFRPGQTAVEQFAGGEEPAAAPDGSPSPAPGGRAKFVPASEVTARRVEWLWRGRLPLGHVTVLAGDPGEGKSIVTLDLAARLSRGDALPGEARGRPPAESLLVNCEDNLEDTLKARLQAMGADVRRVHFLDMRAPGAVRPMIPEDLLDVEEWLGLHPTAKLVVFDPLNAFLPLRLDSHKDQDVRQALAPLAALAERFRLSVVLVVHLNKTFQTASALYRASGSIGVVAAPRSVLFIGRDQDTRVRAVAQAKPQLGPMPPALSFDTAPLDEADPDSPAVVKWGEETLARAEELIQGPAKERDSAVAMARVWLEAQLAAGPRPASEVKAAAEAAGHSLRALERAKAQPPRVQSERLGTGWLWSLRVGRGGY